MRHLARFTFETIAVLAILLMVAAPTGAGGHGSAGGMGSGGSHAQMGMHHGFDGHHDFGGHHRFDHFRGRFLVAPVYPFYGYYPPTYDYGAPAYWYYCPSYGAYYPDVVSCPDTWVPVPAS